MYLTIGYIRAQEHIETQELTMNNQPQRLWVCIIPCQIATRSLMETPFNNGKQAWGVIAVSLIIGHMGHMGT